MSKNNGFQQIVEDTAAARRGIMPITWLPSMATPEFRTPRNSASERAPGKARQMRRMLGAMRSPAATITGSENHVRQKADDTGRRGR